MEDAKIFRPTAELKCFITKYKEQNGIDKPGLANAPVQDSTGFCIAKHLTLMQKWIDNIGNHEWRAIEIVKEDDLK